MAGVNVQPGSPTAFEDLVEHYDAARPRYPQRLYDVLPLEGADVLELGAGTGIASAELATRCGSLVVSDLGPRMLSRGLDKHDWPGVVCRAEALPFPDACFDLVCGAQMWHWTGPEARGEAARVLREGGQLALWWNEVVGGSWWWDAQQDRLEAGNKRYSRGYRDVDYAVEMEHWFVPHQPREVRWSRLIDLDTYERWLRSKSYVAALEDVDSFVAACRDDLLQAFPDGVVVEPFVTRLWLYDRR